MNTPNFSSCSSPTGDLKVSYKNGSHGIVGDSVSYEGSDAVYIINDNQLIQCFCSPEGTGIQTDWWKIDRLTPEEIGGLEKLGWFFVPSGSAWGLDASPYLAKNSNYACGLSSYGIGGQVLGLATTGNSLYIFALLVLGLACFALSKKLRRY
ncbi:MAG: hypothetical protein ABIB61_04805 [Candidatus Shapirobacteria bacterium]